MMRFFGVQSEPGRRWVGRLALLFALAVAFSAWGWVLQKTLLNEREAMYARLQKQRQEQFEQAFDTVNRRLKDALKVAEKKIEKRPTVLKVGDLIRDKVLSGVVFPEERFEAGQEEGPWLSDDDGRDVYAQSLLGEIKNDEALWKLLRERLEGKVGPEMKSSFRVWLIQRALEERDEEDGNLIQLARSEEARALGEAPRLSLIKNEEGLVYWWDVSLLGSWFEEAGARRVEFGEDGRPFEGWDSELRVKLKEQILYEGDFEGSQRLLKWMAVGSGVLFFGIVSGALWMGWREMNLARMRTDLAASVAHELRTPLAGQRVLLESLEKGLEQSPEERAEYVNMALRSNKKLSGLVGQFLTFSRLQRGVLQLEGEQVELREVVEEVMQAWSEKFDEVTVEVEDELVMNLDREAVCTMMRNLVENAWKYTEKEEKKLMLQVSSSERRLCFSVEDNGNGLSESDRKKAFRRFWRADNGLARTTEGLGLGLSIVKSLVQAHGGTVELDESVLGGARFQVYLEEI